MATVLLLVPVCTSKVSTPVYATAAVPVRVNVEALMP